MSCPTLWPLRGNVCSAIGQPGCQDLPPRQRPWPLGVSRPQTPASGCAHQQIPTRFTPRTPRRSRPGSPPTYNSMRRCTGTRSARPVPPAGRSAHRQRRPQVEAARHRRLHRTRRHRVDQDAAPDGIPRQPFHQRMHRTLRRRIIRRRGQRGAAGLARHRTHQRDMAAAMCRHVLDRGRSRAAAEPAR